MSLSDTISKSETLAWGVTAGSAAVLFPSWIAYKHLLDRSVCDNINQACGTSLTLPQCRQFKDEYVRNGNGKPSLASAKDNFKTFVRNPAKATWHRLTDWWQNIVVRSWQTSKLTAPLAVTHEIGLTVGSTAFEINLAFLSEKMGANFWSALGVFVPIGYASTIIRRLKVGSYISNQFNHFLHPSPAVCDAAREFAGEPAVESSSEMSYVEDLEIETRSTFDTLMSAAEYLTNIPEASINRAMERPREIISRLEKIEEEIRNGNLWELPTEDRRWFEQALYGDIEGYRVEELVGKARFEEYRSWATDGGVVMADGSYRLVGPNYSRSLGDVSVSEVATFSILSAVILAPYVKALFAGSLIEAPAPAAIGLNTLVHAN